MRNGLRQREVDVRSNASSAIVAPKALQNMTEVEQALHRKKISNDYHTSVPKFLRSQGPFAVYDHHAHKGDRAYQTVGSVNEQALNRFNQETEGVQKQRETEKNMFYSAMEYMDRLDAKRCEDKRRQNLANREFLRNQIAEK